MEIPLNAFSSITISGLVFKAGVPCSQTFSRGIVEQGKQLKLFDRSIVDSFLDLVKPEGIPPRPLSKLPPPGDQHVTLILGQKLGSGRTGAVYAVDVVEQDLMTRLPKLVVKISRRLRSTGMAKETWFYEELEQVQGISVPRCYGFFQARLHTEQSILLLNERGKDDDRRDVDSKFEKGEEEYEAQFPGEGRLLSILLLERLGGYIPVNVPIDDIKKDVTEVFNDLARYGIECMDLRWSNILSVLDRSELSGTGNLSSGEICPNHGHGHGWRIVDLEGCRKSDGKLSFLDNCNQQWIDRLLDNLVWGCILEPWD